MAIFIFAAALLIIFFLWSRRKKTGGSSVPKAGIGKINYPIPDDDGAPEKISLAEAQRQVWRESYPALKDISYARAHEDFSPMTEPEVNPAIVKAVKEKIANLKSIPVNYFSLMNSLRNPEANAGEISAMVMTNPVVSARILQTVNSAYFNLPDKITSVGRAITLLGFNNVRAIFFQDALKEMLPAERFGTSETYAQTWAHSAVVSVCSGHLGKQLFQYSEYELATLGLLHDIGKYFIGLLEPLAEEAAELPLPLLLREERKYGINHAALGGLIAHNWQLSDSIVQGIAYHHHPVFSSPEAIPELYRINSFVISLSDLICKALGYGAGDGELWQIKSDYYESFKLEPDIMGFITPELIKKIEKTYLTVQSYIATS